MAHSDGTGRPSHESEVGELVADVVVLGTGPAGMAAVAAAAEAGVDVVAVEALDAIGGNCVWSTGYMAFVDSRMQHEQGIHDDVDMFVNDAARMVAEAGEQFGLTWDEDLVRLYAQESARTYDSLVSRGVTYSRFIPRPRQHSVDRMVATVDTWAFRRAFEPDFDRPNVTTLFSTTATRLRTDGRGRVTGVLATRADGTKVEVGAARGVVLATGGYQANPELRQRYQPHYLATGPYLGVGTCRGDGHLMGQAVGGDLVNMTHVPPLVIVSSSLVEDAIAVNLAGERFHDEAGPYDGRVAALLQQPDRRGWYVFDRTVAEEKAQLVAQMPRPGVSAASLAELASAVGVPAEALRTTVTRWNAFLAGGQDRDPDTGRVVMPPGRRGCVTPPFTAVPMTVGVNFVSGGFRATQDLQVIDVFGDPVPGLYAAGDTLGGLAATADLGGTRIAAGFTLGRLAGQSAAEGRVDTRRRHSVQGAFLPSQLDTRLPLVQLDA